MTLETINNLTVEETFDTLLNRLIDFSIIKKGEMKFIFADGLGTKHDRLILNSRITKPQLSDFEAELLLYQEELRFALGKAELEEELRKKEEARISALQIRIDAVPNMRECVSHLSIDAPNIAIFRVLLLDEEDLLIQIETISPSLSALQAKKEVIANTIKKGKDTKEFCNKILHFVAGSNVDSEATDEQIDKMLADLEPIEKALKDNRPMKAKALIEAITDENYLVLKTIVLELYTEVGY